MDLKLEEQFELTFVDATGMPMMTLSLKASAPTPPPPPPPPPPPDTTKPTVRIIEPVDGSSLTGMVRIRVTSDEPAALEIFVDGIKLAATAPGATECLAVWDTTGAIGNHKVAAFATDTAGNIGDASVNVSVPAPPPPPPPPPLPSNEPDWIELGRGDRFRNPAKNPTALVTGTIDASQLVLFMVGENKIVVQSGGVLVWNTVKDTVIDTIKINAGGTLRFRTDINTRLVVKNLIVMPGGTLEVGTAFDPIKPGVKAEIHFADTPLDLVRDPEQYGNGLIALGKVTMHGVVKADTFLRLTAEPKVGQAILTLAQPASDWALLDRLILPDTRHLKAGETWSKYVPQWETATIQGISADGKSITLSAPLKFDHIGARNGDNVLEFLPHVGNLSRNVVVRSQNASGVRGHCLFGGRADVDIRYIQFGGLGRTKAAPIYNTTYNTDGSVRTVGTNQIGRYPIHFHHLMGPATTPANGYQYTFVGNAVTCPLDPMPFKWGIVLHDSHYGLIQGNVLFNWGGACLVTEDGSESYNVIEKNFAVAARGNSNPRYNDGLDGSLFWFAGYNNYVRDNVASSGMTTVQQIVAGVGYKYYVPAGGLKVRVPLNKGADTSVAGQYKEVQMRQTPILEFARNEAYGAMATGLTIWHLGTGGYFAENIGQSVIKDFRAWHVHDEGFFGYPIHNMLFDGFVVRGHTRAHSAVDGGKGWLSGDYWAENITLRNADIQGMYWNGISSFLNAPGVFRIENSYLRNVMGNISIQTPATPGSGAFKPPRRTEIVNVRFDSWPSKPLTTIEMDYNVSKTNTDVIQRDAVFVVSYNGVFGDDFQLYYTEQAPGFVVPQSTTAPNQLFGCPEAGLTNAQAWAKWERRKLGNGYEYQQTPLPGTVGWQRIAVAGAVAPADATTRQGIVGLVKKP